MIQSLFSCFPGAIGRLLILQHEDFKKICKFALECYLVVCVDWCHRMSLNLGTWKFSRKFISMFTIRSFAMPNFSSIYLQCHPPVRESANSWMLHYFICVRIYDHAIELFNYLFLFYFSILWFNKWYLESRTCTFVCYNLWENNLRMAGQYPSYIRVPMWERERHAITQNHIENRDWGLP